MRTRNILFVIVVVAVAIFLARTFVLPPPPPIPPPCELEAPDSAYVVPTNSTTAELFWSPVDSAAGYQITVFDSTTQQTDTIDILNGQTTSYQLTGLVLGNSYSIVIAAYCDDDGPPSINTIQLGHEVQLIINDVVMMLDAPDDTRGFELCNCSRTLEEVYTNDPDNPWIPGLAIGDRRTFLFRLDAAEDGHRNLKLSFTHNDCGLLRFHACSGGAGSVSPLRLTPEGDLEAIEVTIGDNTFRITSFHLPGLVDKNLLIQTISCGAVGGCRVLFTECTALTGIGCGE
ncbi:MAG: fibronectin type III domain-containing protein [Bacteroidota bacterium]